MSGSWLAQSFGGMAKVSFQNAPWYLSTSIRATTAIAMLPIDRNSAISENQSDAFMDRTLSVGLR
jgi:hypothetical protein